MVWSNWQAAMRRGALVVVLAWSGLAWTQTSTPQPADPAERIMVVHENGKSTRCKVLETWQLPDGRVAHLLQALETREMITIVDEVGPTPETIKNPRAMPKRIFAWGQGQSTPPDGSPVPPHLRMDSGVVIKNEKPAPADATKTPGPSIVNRAIDEKALGGSYHSDGPIMVVQGPARVPLRDRLLGRRDDPQVVEMPGSLPLPPVAKPGAAPMIVNGQPVVGVATNETPAAPGGEPGKIVPLQIEKPAEKPMGLPDPKLPTGIAETTSTGAPKLPGATDLPKPEPYKIIVVEPKKSWRPGANIQAWLAGKPAAKQETAKVDAVKADDAKKFEQLLAEQNKAVDKELTSKIEKAYGAPFSTAKMPGSNVPADAKKPEPSPLVIPVAKETKPVIAPGVPKEEPVKVAEKTDMWGNSLLTPVPAPGKTLLPPPPVASDPLASPERLVKGGMVPAFGREPSLMPPQGWPLGTQSVQAAHTGILGTPMYVPVPTVTVPQPIHPPTPPAPKLEAPNLNTYVNAFTPPPAPKGAPQSQPMQGMMTMPPMNQQQMMMQQQLLAQQQMIAQQQLMMQYGYRPNPMVNPYMASPPSSGPMANFSRQYAGPMPPTNPYVANPTAQTGYAPAPYPAMVPTTPPMMPMSVPLQPVSHQQPVAPTQQPPVAQQVDQLIKSLRESPYPAQREWAAQSLASFEWRAHPQVVPALVQSASQDPAASVRAGCANCLGRMNAAVEPVFGALHAMRNDIDPRVRQEVEQALTRLGQGQ